MTSVVRFSTQSGKFALPVANVREVRSPKNMMDLPSPIDGVAGLLHMEGGALTVVSMLGKGDKQVLVAQADDRRFGILVEEVTGIASIDERSVAPAPAGQAEGFITGVVEIGEDLVLMIDARAVARRLNGNA